MSVYPKLLAPEADSQRINREHFRRWAAEQQAGRFERHDGWVVAMAPERLSHVHRKSMVWLILRQAIIAAGLSCGVFADGATVEVEDSDYEPDAVVRCRPPLPADAIAVPDPMVLVEVLSPATRSIDLTRKPTEYFKLPTVQHYLIFWADKPQVIDYRRRRDGIETRMINVGGIPLDPPGIEIPIADIYAGTGT